MGRDGRAIGIFTARGYVGGQAVASQVFTPHLGSSIAPVDEHSANTLASRGVFVPYIAGRRRGGAVMAWVGDRFVKKEGRVSGKGGGADRSGGQPVYYEAGWHLLCVGPAIQLNAIYKGGTRIWEGPIDSTGSPSGTTIQVSKRESFTIYWGEVNQPINSFLGDVSRVGVSSRWPHVCYVVWNNAKLGGAPNWPIFEYDIEVPLTGSILTETSPDMGASSCAKVGGVNAGHLVSQILFDGFPHGLSLDQTLFDLPSLEYLARATGAPSLAGLPTPPPDIDTHYDARDINGDSTVPDVGTGISTWVDIKNGDDDLTTPVGYSDPLYKEDGCEGLYYRRPAQDGASVNGDGHTVASWNEIESPSFVVFGAMTLDPNQLTFNSGSIDPEFMNRYVFSINDGSGSGSGHKKQISLEFEWDMEFIGSPVFDYDKSTIRPRFALRIDNGTTLYGITNFNLAPTQAPVLSRKTTVCFAIILRNINDLVVDAKFRFVGYGDQGWREYDTTSPSAPTGLTTLDVGFHGSISTSFQNTLDEGHLGEAVRLNELIFEHGYGDPGMPQSNADDFLDYLVSKWSCGGVSECIVSSLLSQEGETAEQAISKLMGDIGFLVPWNPVLGKHQFSLLRKVGSVSTLATIPSKALADPVPTIELPLIEATGDKLVFGFADFEHNFDESTLAVDDDGVADLATYQRAIRVDLPTIIDYDSAGTVAERKAQELLSQPVRYEFLFTREASRYIHPGRPFYVEGISEVLRCLNVRMLHSRGEASVVAIVDVWGGTKAPIFQLPSQGTGTAPGDPEADVAVGVVEVPAYLLGASTTPAVAVPRIPGSDQISGAVPHFSNDNVTYIQQDEQNETVTGGTLLDPLAASTPGYILDGPTFTALGSDITDVLDLSSSLSLWAMGYQLCLINDEVFFLQGVEALGGSTYRLKGLMRARYDTRKAAHSVSDNVFILLSSQVRLQQDPLTLVPARTLYVKSQPFKNGAGLSLASISPVSRTLRGKGLVPMDCESLRTNEGRNSYTTGQDVPLKWTYQSALLPGTGAGMQDAGTPTGDAPVDGYFRLRFYSIGSPNVLQRTVEGLTGPSYTYTNANLVSDMGGEVDFLVSVTNYKAGYESTELFLTVVAE